MSRLGLNEQEKQKVQELIEQVQSYPQHKRDEFLEQCTKGRDSFWSRFLKAGFNQPITWWVGVFQLQMQMGIWGQQHRGNAQTRASILWQTTRPIWNEIVGLTRGEEATIIKAVVKHCAKHYKADIAGRFAAGFFTNYAVTGGRAGQKVIPTGGHIAVGISNFVIASYGAAIKAIANGMNSQESILQAIMIGKASGDLINTDDLDLDAEETALFEKICAISPEVFKLSQITPGPVPLSDFCARPENVNLKGVCR